MKSIVQIGKNGLTDGSVALIKRELKQKEQISVKMLPAALPLHAKSADRKQLADDVVAKTGATLVKRVGNVLFLQK